MAAPQGRHGQEGAPTQPWSSATAFMLPPKVPTNRNTPWGPGIIVPVTAAANTPTIVKHGLGRLVQGMWCIANDGGALPTPRLQFGPTFGQTTMQEVGIQGDEQMVNALVVML